MFNNAVISGYGFIKPSDKNNGFNIINEEYYEELLKGISLKYIDKIGRLILLAIKLALKGKERYEDINLILGTEYGPLSSIHSFDSVAVRNGALSVNPSLFPNTVLNSPICLAGIHERVKESMDTIYTGLNSGLDAIGIAWLRISSGKSNSVIAGGADDLGFLQQKLYQRGKNVSEASAFLLLKGSEYGNEEKLPEIFGYETTCFYRSDLNVIIDGMKQLISQLLKNNRARPKIYVSICSDRTKEDEEEIVEAVRIYVGTNKNEILLYDDYLGATGALQTIDFLQYGGEFEIGLVCNIGGDRVSVLAIKNVSKSKHRQAIF